MEVTIQTVDYTQIEKVIIECHKITEAIEDIRLFVNSRSTNLMVYQDGKILHVPLSDIYYVEAVDNRVFVYLAKEVYEIKMKLYEFEDNYKTKSFFRCSKQTIMNLMKIVNIKPALNGRFSAELSNHETIIITRKYVNDLFAKLRGADR